MEFNIHCTTTQCDTFCLYSLSAGYDRVRSHLVDITNLLKTTGAREDLTQHFMQMRWLGNAQNPSENELVQLALQRIKIDPGQYDMFLTMLRAIQGLDLIVNAITRGQGEV